MSLLDEVSLNEKYMWVGKSTVISFAPKNPDDFSCSCLIAYTAGVLLVLHFLSQIGRWVGAGKDYNNRQREMFLATRRTRRRQPISPPLCAWNDALNALNASTTTRCCPLLALSVVRDGSRVGKYRPRDLIRAKNKHHALASHPGGGVKIVAGFPLVFSCSHGEVVVVPCFLPSSGTDCFPA